MTRRLGLLACVVIVAAACTSGDARPSAGASASSSAAPLSGAAVPARPSAGCSSTKSAHDVDSDLKLTSGGVDRSYFLHVPASYDGTQPMPVVLDFHGYAEGATLHKTTSQLGPFGDSHSFITATPAGTGPVPRWDTTVAGPDVQFVSDLIDALEHQLCVDERRVYATGYSNGAMLSSAIACQLGDRVAAIAPVAGLVNPDGCTPKRSVPIIAFHGTDDPIVAFKGGVTEQLKKLPAPDGSGRTLGDLGGALPSFSPIPDVIAKWAQLDGCTNAPPTESKAAADVTLVSFACTAPVDVELYRIEGGGHTWPGSTFTASIAQIVGPTTMSINADDLMWSFFEAHPLSD